MSHLRSRMERTLQDGPKVDAGAAVTDLRALAQVGTISRTEPWTQHYRSSDYGRTVRSPLAGDVVFAPGRIRTLFAARRSDRGFLVRLFMIQHDCGHGSFFRHRLVNDWVGRVIGVFTLTPYDSWRRAHGIHHATSGNLDQRGSATSRRLPCANTWRCPLAPVRLSPLSLSDRHVRRRPDLSVLPALPPSLGAEASRLGVLGGTMATNGGTALVVVGMIWWVGVGPFVLVHLPITLVGAPPGCGCSTFSTNSNIRSGLRTESGAFPPRRCTGVTLWLADASLVHRQYRHAPYSPPVQP